MIEVLMDGKVQDGSKADDNGTGLAGQVQSGAKDVEGGRGLVDIVTR